MAVDIFARTVALASLGNSSEGSYTKAEIDKMFGEAGTVQVEAVDVLPTENIKENVIYLVPNGSSGENYYDECMYINGKWEVIGTTEIDLSNYYTKDEVNDRSIVNIALPNSTFETGIIRQEDYQAFLPLLQFLYTKCRGISGNRFIKLPLVNINAAHDSSTWIDLDNGQLFIVNESYTKTNNTINVRLDGVPKFNESGVAKYFSLYVGGNIENDNITSIRSVSINKSTIPVATKKYVDDSKNYVGEYKFLILDDIYSLSKEYFDSVLLPAVKSVGWEKVVVILSHSIAYNAMGLYMFHQKIESTDGDGNAIQTIIFETIHPNIWEQYKGYYTSGSMLIEPTTTQIVLTITNDEFANATFNYKRSGSGSRLNLLPIDEDAKNAPKVFIPTYDAEPATKKYVDDAISQADATYYWNGKYTGNEAMLQEIYDKIVDGKYVVVQCSENIDCKVYTGSNVYIPIKCKPTFIGATYNDKYCLMSVPIEIGSQIIHGVEKSYLAKARVNFTISDNVVTNTTIENVSTYSPAGKVIPIPLTEANQGNYTNSYCVLDTKNKETYNPTEDYHPATKKYVDDKVEKDAIVLEVYIPNRTDVTLNTQENRDKLNIWFNDVLNKNYYRPLYIKSNATVSNLKMGSASNKYLYKVLMTDGFPLKDKPSDFKFYCLPTFASMSSSVLFGVHYRSAEQLETRARLSWNDDGSFAGVAAVYWGGSGVYLPINYTGTSNSSLKHLPLGVGNTTAYTPTGDYNPATKKYVDDAIANINVSFDDVYVVTCGHRFDGSSYNITDDGSIAEMMNTYWPKYLANSNQGGLVIWKDYTGATNGTTLIGYMRGTEIYIQWPWTFQNNTLASHPYGSVGVVTITGSWDSSTETYTLTKAVWDRINYVPTEDWNPANKKYVDKSIRSAIAGVTQFSLIPVDTLPIENIRTDAIYAIPSDNPQEQDVRVEYVYINDSWEKLGNTKIDLSNYYTKAEIDTKLEELHNLINTNTTVATSDEVTNVLNGTTTNGEVTK